MQVKLGSTNIVVEKKGFGAIPILRIGQENDVFLLRKAYKQAMNFFDIARSYTECEEKMG